MPPSDKPAARLLVVDDEIILMRALCETLRDHGYETTGFTAAEAALDAMKQSKFDLLLTDLMMPGMDGISLLLAARETDPDLIGIMMTGAGTVTSAVDAMKAGAFDYVLKPFELSIVLPVLARALSMRQLRAENAALDKWLRERTAELEAANRELEAFSYSVSHDLRAPLRALDGYAHLLLSEYSPQLPEGARQFLGGISDNARRMGQLVDDLLRFSKLGRQPLSLQPVNLSALVNEVLAELSLAQQDRVVEVKVMALPNCNGDASLLRQVFLNLLSNAFKYSVNRSPALIEVGSRMVDDRPVYYVRDNGAGFDMRYADKLFRVFQRLHRIEEFEGTGVGLSIVQRIVQRHGGNIWAESEVDKGATFYFTLQPASVAAK
jgi:two-component system, sensor histidine kinase and response regulator